ncbi:DUF4037 domain-containing protein [Candidatus Aerophobetes bacterium]|nr:DUF4037 domain-containing protein [Candidatus Aerophobetes bacterium]
MSNMREFVPGLKLSELFYKEIVKSILDSEFPHLKYSVGLIDGGSEVLGFDTPQSTDHNWGPRLLLFLPEAGYQKSKERISTVLSRELPPTFRGYSTHFISKPDEEGVQLLTEAKDGQPINHRVDIFTIKSFFQEHLGINPNDEISVLDWLTLSQQRLRTIRSGRVFHDGLKLNEIRKKLEYYPKDLWLYLLASQWHRIGQEEPFIGRCGDVGDEVGSRILATRLVKDIISLCFLMQREYMPYSKWLGTAFSRLKCHKILAPIIRRVLSSEKWRERERHLSRLYKEIAKMHNHLGITKPLITRVSHFYTRPYLVIHGDVFAREIKRKIKNNAIKNIKVDIGSVNQFSDSTDVLEDTQLLKKFKILYN